MEVGTLHEMTHVLYYRHDARLFPIAILHYFDESNSGHNYCHPAFAVSIYAATETAKLSRRSGDEQYPTSTLATNPSLMNGTGLRSFA